MKKTNKRIISLLLACLMMLTFVACSGEEAPVAEENDPQLEELIANEGEAFVESFTSSFEASSGLKCDSTIKVKGTALIIDCNIKNVDNVPDVTKKQMQEAYDGEKASLKEGFAPLKELAPNLSLVAFYINEQDGDNIATINLEF